ncbi:TPA: hypothetical protein ACX14B_005659 [Citrobacter freundii]|uniref:hypothetical protein n=1 Tax=Citrobacter freundii TaxID=546 RepID=UPI001C66EDF6|nr:hypothetical protein [Citrobacter freundii]
MSGLKKYACYKSSSVKLGFIYLNSNSENLREIFMENKVEIKRKFPGSAFIKLVKKRDEIS